MKANPKMNKLNIMISCLLVLVAIIFYISAVENAEKSDVFGNKLSFINESRAVSPTGRAAYDLQFENEYMNNNMSFIFWGQKDTEEIRNDDLGTAINTPILLTSGDTGILFDSAKTLDYDSRDICLLGRHTAYELFGSTDVEGLSVKYGEGEYIVHGVLEDTGHAFVITTDSEADTGLNRFDVIYESENKLTSTKNKVMEMYSPGTQIQFDILIWMLKISLMIIPVLIAASLVRSMIPEISANRTSGEIRNHIIWIMAALFVCAGVFIFAIWYIDYPVDMIPPKWSDFQFWSKMSETIKESLYLYLIQAKTPVDISFIAPYAKAIAFNLLSILCAAIALRHLKKEVKNG